MWHGVHLAVWQPVVYYNLPVAGYPEEPCQPSPPRDIPQQPSSLLVAGEELGADSIKDDAQIAPAQATPQPPVRRQHKG